MPVDRITSQLVEEFCVSSEERCGFDLTQEDMILIRTNPGRDKKRADLHQNFLDLATVAEDMGIGVWNSPRKLCVSM